MGLTLRKTETLTFPNFSDVSLPDLIRGLWMETDVDALLNELWPLLVGFTRRVIFSF